MTDEITTPNMHKVEKIVLQPMKEEMSVGAASEVLRAAGLDKEQIEPNKLDSHIKQWTDSDQWNVSRSSSIKHGTDWSKRVDGVKEYQHSNHAVARVHTNSWHNKSMETVECPECGAKRTRLAMYGHQHSRQCRAQQNRNKVDESGLKPVHTRSPQLRELIKEHSAVGIETYGTTYIPGSRNKRSKIRDKDYATPDGIQKAKEAYLPSPVTQARQSRVKRAKILWRSNEYCIVATDESVLVIEIEDPDLIYRRRSLYLRKYFGSNIVYNSDGWRVGTPVSGYAGDIVDQVWYSDHADIMIETNDNEEYTVELPHPVDIATRESHQIADEEPKKISEEEAERDIVPESISAGFVPEQVFAAENGVVVEI